jgi:hypothetical protein
VLDEWLLWLCTRAQFVQFGVPGSSQGASAWPHHSFRAKNAEEVMYAYGWFKPPAKPLPEGATPWNG